jgi:Uma2 family endonuclease
MHTLIAPPFDESFPINLDAILKDVTEEDFLELCRQNPDMRIEMSKEGDIIILPPTGGETSRHNFNLNTDLGTWARRNGTGVCFESNAMFLLPNGAKRSPDLSWVRLERWNARTAEQRKSFPPLCPDFVLELRSPSDSLKSVKAKMEEYIENGAELGWLIDPSQKKVYVYRPGAAVEELDNPTSISGEPVLRASCLISRIISPDAGLLSVTRRTCSGKACLHSPPGRAANDPARRTARQRYGRSFRLQRRKPARRTQSRQCSL